MSKPWITYYGTKARTVNDNGRIVVQKENPVSPGAWLDVETYNASWAHEHTQAHLHAQALAHGDAWPPEAPEKPSACIGRPQMPEPSEAELESYRLALGAHDWFYEYSDDHRVWTQGRDSENKLRAMAARLDPDLVIWSEFSPQ